MKTATAYIDGSGNSSRIQACATAIHVDGETESHDRTCLLAPGTTNNVGEYSGLLLALQTAKELGVEVLHIRSDSRLIVEQTKGNWKCKDAHLRILRDKARHEAQAFQKISMEWIPREENSQADALCRSVVKAAQTSPLNPFLRVRSHSLPIAIQ
jgi:ribonuclease HI